METKHTKGTWYNCHGQQVYTEETGQPICVTIGLPDEESEANLKLIAAAPDLLHALELLNACNLIFAKHRGYDYYNSPTGRIVSNAIQKAIY